LHYLRFRYLNFLFISSSLFLNYNDPDCCLKKPNEFLFEIVADVQSFKSTFIGSRTSKRDSQGGARFGRDSAEGRKPGRGRGRGQRVRKLLQSGASRRHRGPDQRIRRPGRRASEKFRLF
jgi:hypothetical protein